MAPPKLRFKQPLSWKAGRPIAVADLLKRLQALAKELEAMGQDDEAPKDDLAVPAKELAHSNLLNHKDKGVRAWTACCLVDMLRVFAPEAPYTGQQLRDIFSLFVRTIVPLLSDTTNPYNAQHIYVLNSLAQVKSIVLLTDVPSSTPLMIELFRNAFNVLLTGGEDVSRNVEYHLTGALSTIIDESGDLPPEIVDNILAQFVPSHKISKSKKSAASEGQSRIDVPLPASYTLAKNICNTCSERMIKYVSHYFSSVILDASSFDNDRSKNGDDEDGGPTDDETQQLEKAHRLLRELWRACPGVLQNVIPQVEQELSAESTDLRLMATSAIGDMVAGIGSSGPPPDPVLNPAQYPQAMLADADDAPFRTTSQPFAQVHSSTYRAFLSRKNDKSPLIRAGWTTCIGRIVSTSAGGSGLDSASEMDLVMDLSNMLVDDHEKVRTAAIQVVRMFDFQGIVDKLGLLGGVDIEGSFFSRLADRCKDKKSTTRCEATEILGSLWGLASGEIAHGDGKVKKLLHRAPSRLLNAYYTNDVEAKVFIDQALVETLLPVGFPPAKKSSSSGKESADTSEADHIRTQRMLLLLDGLDEKARNVFLLLMSRSKKRAPVMNAFIKRCEDYNGGVGEGNSATIKDHLNKLIDHFASTMPDPQKVKEDLKKFAKNHDRRAYVLIRFCFAPESDYRKVVKSFRELERRMIPAHSAIFETLKPLVLQVANLFENKSHIGSIVQTAQSNELGLGSAANDMLKQITTENPAVFKTHAEELCKSIEQNAPSAGPSDVETAALDSLKACSSFAKRFPSGLPKERSFQKAMMQYIEHGPTPTAVKQAVTILLSSSEKKEMHAKDLFKKCVDEFEYGAPGFLFKLACLSQLMLLRADDLSDKMDAVTDIAIKQVLNQVRHPKAGSDSEWQDEPDEECQAKIWALKILVNRLRHYKEPESVDDAATLTYQMLNRLVERHGELSKSKPTPAPHRKRLRLEAALLLVKLSSQRRFDALLSPEAFQQLALVAQDGSFHVRQQFVTKIMKLLSLDRLPSRFYCPIFLLAHEPDRRILDESTKWLTGRAAKSRQPGKRSDVFELALSRLLSLLAHHPDFSTGQEDLTAMVVYVLFYLRIVATAQNISLIYHVAQRVKTVQDSMSSATSYDGDPEASKDLYLLSDLAQAVIRAYQEEKNWSMQAHADKLYMPSGIFKALSSHKAAQEIATRNFVPAEFAKDIDELVHERLRPQRKRKSEHDGGARAAKKGRVGESGGKSSRAARDPKTPSAASKRRRTAEYVSDGADDDDMDVDDVPAEAPSSDRRRSGRATRRSYAETKDSDDDAELQAWDTQALNGAARKQQRSRQAEAEAEASEEDDNSEQADEDDEDEDAAPERIESSSPAPAADGPDAVEDGEDVEDVEAGEDEIADRDGDDEDDAAAADSAKENTAKRSPNDASRTRAKRGSARTSAGKSTTTAKGKASPVASRVSKTRAQARTSSPASSPVPVASSASASKTRGGGAAAAAGKTKGKGKEAAAMPTRTRSMRSRG